MARKKDNDKSSNSHSHCRLLASRDEVGCVGASLMANADMNMLDPSQFPCRGVKLFP